MVHSREAEERSLLSDIRRRCLTSGRPRLFIARMLYVALDLQPPILNVARRVPQRLEGDADLDLESPWRDMSFRLPEKVRAQVVLPRHHVRARNEAAGLAL